MGSFQKRWKAVKGLFTRSNKSPLPLSKPKQGGQEEVILKLKDMEEMLGKKQEYLESLIEKELVIARQNGVKNKRVALQALRRKGRYQKQLLQIDGTLTTLEMQRDNLEGANRNAEILHTMQSAAAAMKEAQRHLDVEKIHDILDDIAEQQDVAKEISDAIAGPIYGHDGVDEDELEKELEALETEQITEDLLRVKDVSLLNDITDEMTPNLDIKNESIPYSAPEIRVPKVSSRHGRKKSQNEEDKELQELAEWAS